MKDWIERYVFAVGEKLPHKQREDIKQELKSAIYDNLDVATDGREATEEDIKSIIAKFGPPREMALKYKPAYRYIVGPELYDSYVLVLGIVLGAMALGLSVAAIVGSFAEDASVFPLIPSLLSSIFSGFVSAIGFVTIIFFIIQKFYSESYGNPFDELNNWNIEDLPSIPETSNSINPIGTIFSIVFILIALAVFNLFPHKIAVFNVKNGIYSFIPLFNLDTLRPYAIYMSIVWFIQLATAIYLLKTQKKDTLSLVIEILSGFAGVAVLFLAAGNKDILNPEAIAYFPSALLGIFRIGVRIFLVFVLLATFWDAGKSVIKIRNHR